MWWEVGRGKRRGLSRREKEKHDGMRMVGGGEGKIDIPPSSTLGS